MRNLKRALSLTLASVMLLGMMVVGSSAVKGYDDVKETDNVEAIEVLQAIQVMVGDERGFGPDRPVNRAEMAVVMGLLLNLDYNYYSATCPFNDVYDWARGWVGACAANGIVSGRGAGVYDPGATVTAVEAASMLMRALGYFKYSNDYADGFEVSTVRQGTNIGIFDGVGSSATEPMTRNQVAQMVLNALKSGVVQPDGNTINLTTPDGSVYTGKVNYVYVTSNKTFATAIHSTRASSMGSTNDAPIVELGEQLFDGKLKLNEYATDNFERPSRYWEYDGKAIGTYVKKELLKAEYTTEVTGKMLYDLLGKDVINTDYLFTVAVDGEEEQYILDGNSNPSDQFYFYTGNMIRTNTKAVGGTGNGVLTQVFVDPDEPTNYGRFNRGTVYVTVINTYLAKANDDYDEKKEEAEFTVYSLEQLTGGPFNGELVKNADIAWNKVAGNPAQLKVKNEDINVEDVVEDDIVLVNVAKGEIQKIFDPEVIAETEINTFKTGKWINNGTQYNYASETSYDPEVLDEYVDENMKNVLYNVYLDQYGYMIGIDIVEATINYAFLTGIDGRTSNLRNKTAEGNLIFLDGTMKTVSIKLDDSNYADSTDMTDQQYYRLNSQMNTWCRYSVDKNGNYVLEEVANDYNTFDAVASGFASKDPKAGQSHVACDHKDHTKDDFNYNTIDKKHPSTLGIIDPVAVAAGKPLSVRMAYGNDDSIYINVSTGLINADQPINSETLARDNSIIIDDVSSVSTGVQNVNLRALTAFEVLTNTEAELGRASGIANVNGDGATLGQLDSVANGVYNLFDRDGAIIAAVVVGEDDAASTGYAYVISGSMEQEHYDKDAEEYTWGRKVIVNGEVTVIEEITAGKHPGIEYMRRGQWYEVKYKADGTVKSVSLIGWDETADDGTTTPAVVEMAGMYGNMTVVDEFWANPAVDGMNGDTITGNGHKFVGLVRKVQGSVTNPSNNLVVLCTDLTGSYPDTNTPKRTNDFYSITPDARWRKLGRTFTEGNNIITTSGNTLWIENKVTDQKDSFTVRNDAKIVLVQDTYTRKNGSITKINDMDSVITYSQTGKAALAKLVNDLRDNENFTGFISAVFEGGVATSVVVWDQTPDEINVGTSGTKPSANTVTVRFVCMYGGSALTTVDVEGVRAGDIVPVPSIYGLTPSVSSVMVPNFNSNTTVIPMVITYT